MFWRDVINLVTVTESENDIGDMVESFNTNEVFANKKSIRQSEFYQAMAHGLKPELMFEINSLDYDGQQKLIYEGKTYQIMRTYSKNDETVELICTGLAVG
jgi:SPP1 family predicted phage head-tail adaptor